MNTKTERLERGKIGNTKQSSNKIKEEKVISKQENQRINWFFTFNNYTDQDIEILESKFKEICIKFCFQEELGENGNKHLQGSIQLKKRMRWSEFGLSDKIHWEITRNNTSADKYCLKEETRNGKQIKFGFPAELKLINKLKPWQTSIIELIEKEVNDRTVYWIYDEVGNMGKTVFSKYLYAKQNAIIATGGGNKDVACLLNILVKNGRDLNSKTTFIFNFPRSTEGISYKAIESVKDGLMTNTKYEANTLVFNCPHVFIFSNELPDLSKLSSDRWEILTINKQDELIKWNKNKPLDYGLCD